MKPFSPQVSVIIPTYNQANYVSGAIASVLSQTYKDYELIVLDDGSTDETAAVVQQFGDGVTYVYQENLGLAAARNAGIRHAGGTYVAFLDSDDRWALDFLDRMTALTATSPDATVCYCGSFYIDANDKPLPQLATTTVIPPAEVYETFLRANFLNANALLLKRKAALAVGLFDTDFRRLQDWEFWLRLARDGARFCGTAEPLVYYRLHQGALSADTTGGEEAALALAAKHVGPDDGRPETWSPAKRRLYGGVYRYRALLALQRRADWTDCATYLKTAVRYDPTLAEDPGLFYELALGTQPLGYRGTSEHLNLRENEQAIKRLLETVLVENGDSPVPIDRAALYASVYLALGHVAYRVQAYGMCREWLVEATRHQPALWRDYRVTGMMGKTLLGHENVRRLRHARSLLRT